MSKRVLAARGSRVAESWSKKSPERSRTYFPSSLPAFDLAERRPHKMPAVYEVNPTQTDKIALSI